MGAIFTTTRHTRQPPRCTTLSSEYELTFALLPEGDHLYDAVSKVVLTTDPSGGNSSLSACAGGTSRYYASQNAYAEYVGSPRSAYGTGNFAILLAGTFEAVAAATVALSNDAGQAAGFAQWRMQPNYNGSATSAGAMCFLTYGGTVVATGANSLFSAGEYCVFLGVRRGTTVELWKNGILVASNTGTAQNISSAETQSIGYGWNGTYLNTAGGHRVLGAGIKGTVTADAAASLSLNPWQVFTPRPRRIFTAAATGGPTYTLAVSPLALTLAGSAVTLAAAHKVAVSPLALALTGNAVILKASHNVAVSPLALTLTGNAITLKAAHKVAVSPLALTLAGNAITLKASHALAVSPLALTLAGNDVALTYTPAGALLYDTAQTVDGFAVNSLAVNGGLSSYSLYVTPMALTTAGSSIGLYAGRKLSVAPLALTLAASAVTLKASHKLAVSPMALAITLNPVTLLKGGKRIAVDTMALALTGSAVTLKASHGIVVGTMALEIALTDVIPLAYGFSQGYDKQLLCPAPPLTKNVQDLQWKGWFLNLRRAAAHGAGLPGVRAFTLGTREVSYGDILPTTSVGAVVTGAATSGGYGAPTAAEYNALVAQVAALRAALISAGIAIT
jgi:hypothetical protein